MPLVWVSFLPQHPPVSVRTAQFVRYIIISSSSYSLSPRFSHHLPVFFLIYENSWRCFPFGCLLTSDSLVINYS